VVFAHQMAVLIEQLRLTELRLDDHFVAKVQHWPILGRPATWLHSSLPAATEHAWLKSGADAFLGTAAAASRDFLIGTGTRLVELGLALFLLFFLLRDGPQLLKRLEGFIPLEEARRKSLLVQLGNTTRAVVYGSGVTAFVQGAMVGLGFAVCGLPAPLVFGAVAAILALLPIGGAGLVWFPGVIVLFAQGRPGWAVALGILGVGISLMDNVLRPLLVSSQAPVSSLMVFVGAIGGASAFGMIGLVLGPVLLSLVAAVLRFLEEARSSPCA
jgi:predicted PurR-regulated permease PerM